MKLWLDGLKFGQADSAELRQKLSLTSSPK